VDDSIEPIRRSPENAKKAPPVDLNSATEAELKALPGIVDTYAKKIMEHRPHKRRTSRSIRRFSRG
jgi:competence protein ComEA